MGWWFGLRLVSEERYEREHPKPSERRSGASCLAHIEMNVPVWSRWPNLMELVRGVAQFESLPVTKVTPQISR